ncbi:hypothetical protein [Bradyrhizobium sp. DOA1]|uniref:hypothetical protein n=1 Tax=Bradyrhizobium sp. DOA1 TaxID=1126616 RepID=UPI000B0D286D|nr:hypothetical protein [Bradyrhizobium sp. DOA1]
MDQKASTNRDHRFGMKQPDNDEGEDPPYRDKLQAEARRVIQDYIENLRELIRKLRGKPH